MKRGALLLFLCGFLLHGPASAQAREGVMSDGEIESLRDAAYIPADRIVAYENILDTRSARVDALLKGRRHVSFEQDLHELLDQFSAIADELNDNLDEYRASHRDIRQALPKLEGELDRWSKALEATPQNPGDKVIRKLAVDAVEDVRQQVKEMRPELEAYFTAHPEAAKVEKERVQRAHNPRDLPPQ